MKLQFQKPSRLSVLLTIIAAFRALVAGAQSTEVTYLGQLVDHGTNFSVSVAVTNGLFTVVLGDPTVANMAAISGSLFSQPNLQLRIWFNDGVNGFAALSPVQNLTPAPYAIYAENLAGGLTVQNNNPNGAPNVIGGSLVNYVASGVIGATIGGGGAVNDGFGITYSNRVTANFGTVSGGLANTASDQSTVSGGYDNTASGNYDQNGLNFYTDYTKRVTILNTGHMGIGTTNATHLLTPNGGAYCDGGDWVIGLDRNAKQDFAKARTSSSNAAEQQSRSSGRLGSQRLPHHPYRASGKSVLPVKAVI